MKAYLRTVEELVTDTSPTTAQFLTNFKTCEIIISKHNLLIMFKTSEWTYQFSHIREAAGLLTPMYASRPSLQHPAPNTALSYGSSALSDRQISAKCKPQTCHCSCTKPPAPRRTPANALAPTLALDRDRGTFPCNPLAVEVSNPPCPLPEGTKQQSKTKEKRAQSSALPLGTHRVCSVKNPSSVHNPGTQARAALQSSPVTLAGRQQLGFMKIGSCDIWLFAETDVFS